VAFLFENKHERCLYLAVIIFWKISIDDSKAFWGADSGLCAHIENGLLVWLVKGEACEVAAARYVEQSSTLYHSQVERFSRFSHMFDAKMPTVRPSNDHLRGQFTLDRGREARATHEPGAIQRWSGYVVGE